MRLMILLLVLFHLSACMQEPRPVEQITGDWQLTMNARPEGVSDFAKYKYAILDTSLRAKMADGRSFDATMGGGDAPVHGQPGWAVSVRQIPSVAIRQVFKYNGKPVQEITSIVVERNTLIVADRQAGRPIRFEVGERRDSKY